MKLVWSPDLASKAYIHTVKTCQSLKESSGVAEFLSAMAAGWSAELIVESWSCGGPIITSIGLAVAARYTSGRHVCVVQDERARSEYVKSMQGAGMVGTEVIVGEAEEVMAGLDGVDFLVVDCKRRDFVRVLKFARLGHKGAVLTCKNAYQVRSMPGFRWHGVLGRDTRVVRSVSLPVGQGLEMAHIGSTSTSSGSGGLMSAASPNNSSHWFKHIDQRSGEEHFLRGWTNTIKD